MSFELFDLPRHLVIRKNAESIAIDRVSGVVGRDVPELPKTTQPLTCDGVLGMMQFPHSRCLVVVASSKIVGSIGSHTVHRVTKAQQIAVTPVDPRDLEYMRLVQQHLNDAALFFSRSYDLTSNMQRTSQKKGLNQRFCWNFEIGRPFADYREFWLPVIYGAYAETTQPAFKFIVLSRRSRFRAGTRYFRRGLDANGNAANFNETEQLLITPATTFSFLQTRGSVPAFWSEINDLQYKPKLRIGSLDESVKAATKHFNEQKANYGTQFLVNLVNQKGYEKPVKEIYERVVGKLNDSDIHYVYFDFHHECSKMRWHRVQLLVDQLVKLGLDNAGWFERQGEKVVREQTGIVRTNCMDCLDRTGVVQSTLGLHALKQQVVAAGIVANGDEITSDEGFMSRFRNIWADNADSVSIAYSGTGALKTDFTRTGQRTKLGALRDLQNSLMRYYRNNFRDGPRQDGYSLFLCDYPQQPASANPFVDRRTLFIQSLPYIFGFCALVTVLSILYPSQKHSALFNCIVTSVFALTAVQSLRFMMRHGMQYVNWPCLTPVRFVSKNSLGEYHIENEDSEKGQKQD